MKKVRLDVNAGKYILEATLSTEIHGKTYSKTYSEQRAGLKQNEAMIQTLLLGLNHLIQSTELEICIPKGYLEVSLLALPRWKENGFVNGKGKALKYQSLWLRVSEKLQMHEYSINTSKEDESK